MVPRVGPPKSRMRFGRVKDVATVEEQIGRAEQGEDTWPPQECELHIELKPDVSGEDQEKIMADLGKAMGKFPGLQYEVVTFLGDRISETISGEAAPLVINVFGDDLDAIDAKAAGNRASARDRARGEGSRRVKVPAGITPRRRAGAARIG